MTGVLGQTGAPARSTRRRVTVSGRCLGVDVVASTRGGIAAGKLDAQKETGFAAPDLLEFAAPQAVDKAGVLIMDLHAGQPPAGRRLAARSADVYQQVFAARTASPRAAAEVPTAA